MIQIYRGFTDKQWERLRSGLEAGDGAAWSCAVDMFERRVRERLVSCIDALEQADSRLDVDVSAGASPDRSTLPRLRPGDASNFWCQAGARRGGRISPTRIARRGSRGNSVSPSYALKRR